MSLFLDTQYAVQISSRLRNFKRKPNNIFNFSCCFCGDSVKNKSKARGYLFPGTDGLIYKCHNCEHPTSFAKMLAHLDSVAAEQYNIDKFLENKPKTRIAEVKDSKPIGTLKVDRQLQKISTLPTDHPAKQYVVNRKIPSKIHFELFYINTFKKWVNTIVPGTYQEPVKFDEPRLVIPLIDRHGNVMGYQGRSFDPKSNLKYVTILLNPSNSKIYGMNHLDFGRKIYGTEGPIDAMFVPNAIASCGGTIETTLESLGIEKDKLVLVYDNEPRNKFTVAKMHKAEENGFNVCVWPTIGTQFKDINDLVQEGFSPQQIKEMIDENTFQGLAALIKINSWKRVN